MKDAAPNAEPVLILFDADHPEAGGSYGYEFDAVFLRALKAIDRAAETRSLVLRGDLLLDSLCYKPSRVASEEWTKSKRSGHARRSSSTELSADMGFFKLLIGDLTDAFGSQAHTLDLVKFPELLMQLHTFYCIFLPSLPPQCFSALDKVLRHHPCYLGVIVPDLSNPLQRELLLDSLIRDAFIDAGAIYMALDIEGYLNGDFHGADKFSSRGIVALPATEFAERVPSIRTPGVMTARAMVTLTRLQNRQALNVHQRLARELSSLDLHRDPPLAYDWDLKQLPNAPDEVDVQARKLTDYLLNHMHDHGASKARFFETQLGITMDDWRFLHAQFIDALKQASFDDIRLDQYGIRFSAALQIRGRNGSTATVHSAWIVRPKERASLVTAFPGAKGAAHDSLPLSSSVVPPDLKGAERWRAIFELARDAGKQAEAECVPTPMKISGGELIMDGECGGAYVRIPDARKGFAHWLKTNGHGDRDHRVGILFYAETNTQSADRAMAYAEAFAQVLRRNGVECSATRYLT